MRRRNGIIAILVGIGLLLVSGLFSSGYSPKAGIVASIPQMRIVFVKGRYVHSGDLYSLGHYEGRVALPLKYPLSLSVVIILLGTGVVLTSEDKETA